MMKSNPPPKLEYIIALMGEEKRKKLKSTLPVEFVDPKSELEMSLLLGSVTVVSKAGAPLEELNPFPFSRVTTVELL